MEEKVNPFPNKEFLDLSKLKEFTDNTFKFNENSRKFSKGRKNCGKKEKLLITSNFSFPAVFSKELYCRHIKNRACLGKDQSCTKKLQVLTPTEKAFENNLGKEENAGTKHFLYFELCFLPHQRLKSFFNFLPHNPNFQQPWGKKTFENIWLKLGKILVTSIFPFLPRLLPIPKSFSS